MDRRHFNQAASASFATLLSLAYTRAHALSLGVTLVSHGTREFERVPGLNSRTGPTTLSIAVAGAGLD